MCAAVSYAQTYRARRHYFKHYIYVTFEVTSALRNNSCYISHNQTKKEKYKDLL